MRGNALTARLYRKDEAMLKDLGETSGDVARDTEVCVIGAGAAGITIARRLLERGHQLVLLESGGRDYEAGTSGLNAGENVGEDYYPLDHARLRLFGGTTAIWGGRCAELDRIDIEDRPWVPQSGWPVPYEVIKDYYRQAWPLFGLAGPPGDAGVLRQAGVPIPRFDPERLTTPLWGFDARFDRFGLSQCRDILDHPRCEVFLHATAMSFEAATSGRGIERIVARALNGSTLTVRARVFILASGGIENARLLLASRSVMPRGLGNEHDNVGRYFMEHPHARGGRIVAAKAWPLLKAFGRRHRVGGKDLAALIAPSPALQKARGILNTSLTIVARQPERAAQFWGMRVYSAVKHGQAPTKLGRTMWIATKRAAGAAQRVTDPLRPWLLHKAGKLDVALLVRGEQAPNRDSRVTLGEERDALGMPRARLDWRLSEIDVRSVDLLVRTLGDELSRLGLGKVEPAAWLAAEEARWQTDPLISAHPIGGYHHMGTTRMSDDPRNGVTDGRTRVHGVANLYVAGSSLFPTGGWANPTLTIAALALRTADDVSATLRGSCS